MSYTPTYRMPRRRNAPLAPAGFACGASDEPKAPRMKEEEGGRRGEYWDGVRGNPTLRRSLTRRASRGNCALVLSNDLLIPFLSLESPFSVSVPQRFCILASHGTRFAPWGYVFGKNWSTSFSRCIPLASFYKMLNYLKKFLSFSLMKFVTFKLQTLVNKKQFFSRILVSKIKISNQILGFI